MARKRPWGRIFGGVIATGLIVLGVWCLLESRDCRRRAEEAQVAEPIHLDVDLSKPGEYVGEFIHTFTAAHGQSLRIETDPPFESSEGAEAAMEGLRAQLTITAAGGKVVDNHEITSDTIAWVWSDDGKRAFPATSFDYFDPGQYKLTLTIEQGAPALANIPHALVARYQLCGLEYLSASIATFVAIGSFVMAAFLLTLMATFSWAINRQATS